MCISYGKYYLVGTLSSTICCGSMAVHGVAAHDSRGRIAPDSDGHGFLQ